MVSVALLSVCGIMSFVGARSSYWILKFLAGIMWWVLGLFWVNHPIVTAGSPEHVGLIIGIFVIGLAFMLMPFWFTRQENGQEVGRGFRLPFTKRGEEEEEIQHSPSREERTDAYFDKASNAVRGKIRR